MPRAFAFERDTFAYGNELVWEYRLDPATGKIVTRPTYPPPTYALHCFVMVRAARQFFYHARFDPAQLAAGDGEYSRLIREVVRRNPRHPGAEEDQLRFPGFSGLRAFSEAHERALKAACGGTWQSYCLPSHWRMVFPYSRAHQARTAVRLAGGARANRLPAVHIVRFPALTINHGLLLYGVREDDCEIRFDVYDPNLPAAPSRLVYQHADRTFYLGPNLYWAGGRVDVMEIYRDWLV